MLKIMVFCVIAPCSLDKIIEVSEVLTTAKHLSNVGQFLRVCTAQYPETSHTRHRENLKSHFMDVVVAV
jgi:hypothetical protein